MARRTEHARGLGGLGWLLVAAVLLGVCASTAGAAFQCGPKPHITTPEPGPNNLCQCGREFFNFWGVWWPLFNSPPEPIPRPLGRPPWV